MRASELRVLLEETEGDLIVGDTWQLGRRMAEEVLVEMEKDERGQALRLEKRRAIRFCYGHR